MSPNWPERHLSFVCPIEKLISVWGLTWGLKVYFLSLKHCLRPLSYCSPYFLLYTLVSITYTININGFCLSFHEKISNVCDQSVMSWSRSYKENFGINLLYAKIQALLLV